MLTVRRLYVYLVAGASLAMLVTGLVQVGAATLELLLGSGVQATYRQTVATFGAAVLVGLPLWLLHWSYAQRLAAREPAERAATLRRLYVYVVLGSLLISIGIFAETLVADVLLLALGTDLEPGSSMGTRLARTAWELAVVAAFWVYTFRIAAADRRAVGETNGSATLRRWYAYGTQFVALLFVLTSTAGLLDTILMNLLDAAQVVRAAPAVATGVAQTIVGLTIWLFHRRWTAIGGIADEDRRTTLRAVHGFLIVAIAVAVTLASIGQILHWLLARLLGVPVPGSSTGGDALTALVGPLASAIVFGAAWALIRLSLARDAAGTEAVRQAGVRRLYSHLVALVALATLAVGAAGLLWTLVDQLVGLGTPLSPNDVRDQISLSVTLVLVGLPIWLLHWRPAPALGERLALSRRLYVFAALLGSVLATLGSGVYLASQLLNLALAVGGDRQAVEIGHALSVLLVALAIAAYHTQVLRRDNAQRAAEESQTVEAVPAPALTATPAATPIVVEIVGASEAEVRAALSTLPPDVRWAVRL
ncbi:MAG: hypothetical protein QOF51_511 [Chloroflexota bacterium]|jgi:hypothetical protein|nr:hypothetical protein [Chloroflexota bacterium]